MNPPGHARIASRVGMLLIAEVEQERESIMREHFTEGERLQLRERHVRTVAGFLAVKRALVRLAGDCDPDVVVSERDFVLSHKENGAPVVCSGPDCRLTPGGVPSPLLRVSVSHTKLNAYGLAVFGGALHG